MGSRVGGHKAHHSSQAQRPVHSSPAPAAQAPQSRPQPKPQPKPQARATGHDRRDVFESKPASPRAAALADKLRSNENFRQLPRGTQARLLATAQRHGQSEQARRNIAALALSKDFDRLSPQRQREAIQTLRKGLGNKGVGKDLADLAGDKDFRRLDAKDQKNILGAVAAQRGDVSARNALVDLGKSSGFRKLHDSMQKRLVDELEKRRQGKAEARFGKAALELADSASFRRLPSDVQSELAKAIAPGRPSSQESRQSIVDLGTNPGLAKLSASTQRKILEHLPRPHAGQEASVGHIDRLTELVDGGEFARLRPELQRTVLDAVRPGRLEPDHEQTLTDLASTKGFAALSAPEQDRLFQYASGTNPLSRHVQVGLGEMLLEKGFKNANAAGQADQLRAFLRDQPSVPEVSSALESNFPARPYTFTGPVEAPGHAFPAGNADALRYEVEIDGQRIPVFISKDQDPSRGDYHSIDEVARGLASLPPASRALVQQVNVNGQRSPNDAYWEQVYGEPGFRSYMTAGADGIVDIYPSAGKASQEEMNSSLIHETGHVLSNRNWGSSTDDPRWDAYKAAIASDGFVPSNYARNAPTEDFAETLVLYSMVRGTPQEAELRALMPNRFRLIDELLARPVTPASSRLVATTAGQLTAGQIRG
jgi:hypothetical protein